VLYEGNLGDSNVMMTIGAARSSDPDSATSQWYINMADNSAGFDDQPGIPGYTVFGHVVSGWDTVLAIYGQNVYNFGSPFSTLPLESSYSGSGMPVFGDFVIIESVALAPEPATVALLAGGGLALIRRRRAVAQRGRQDDGQKDGQEDAEMNLHVIAFHGRTGRSRTSAGGGPDARHPHPVYSAGAGASNPFGRPPYPLMPPGTRRHCAVPSRVDCGSRLGA
jgi:hypothetical protein